jgi:tetratricopeptide (TPR) repeat protein
MTDLNALELVASKAFKDGRYKDALRVYLFMSDGDPSLDAGYLAERVAECCEALGDIPAARFWYGRAIEENPEVNLKSQAARERLGEDSYDELLKL